MLDLLVEYFRTRGVRVATADAARAVVARSSTPRPIRAGGHRPPVAWHRRPRRARGGPRLNPSCYVVIVTGYASLDSAIRAVRLGAYDYLTKPFSLGQLDVILARLRDRLALEEENRRLARQVVGRDQPRARIALTAHLDASTRGWAGWRWPSRSCSTASVQPEGPSMRPGPARRVGGVRVVAAAHAVGRRTSGAGLRGWIPRPIGGYPWRRAGTRLARGPAGATTGNRPRHAWT